MNFGDILDTWEKTQSQADLKKCIREKGVFKPVDRAVSYKRLPIQATLDLHGMTATEAETAMDVFIKNAKKRGLSKVLIIHGKGIHTKTGESVLRETVADFIYRCPFTGSHGQPSAADGGSGATWVIIKQ